jgi:hypothetical protein
MSWDAVPPIITLVGGIGGTLFVQRVQEKRLALERAVGVGCGG